MVYQTHPVDPTEIDEPPLRSAARNTSEFAEDILTLAELQIQLALLDCREWAGLQMRPTLLAIAAGIIALGMVPICFLALAAALVEFALLSMTQALALSAVTGIIISGVLLICAYKTFQAIHTPFTRSLREWDSNLRWFRNMMRREGRRW